MTLSRGLLVRGLQKVATAAAGCAMLGGIAVAQTGMEFMPDGGRTLALKVFEGDSERIAEIAGMSKDEAQWRALVEETGVELSEVQVRTLAGYLALNFPLSEPASLEGLEPDALAAALPRDGKDLSVAHCQSCHSFFTGYLTHDRDKTGWMQTFRAPFHLEIDMTRKEIETFALYSELNMPMSFDEVPPEWRF
jgi:hypothetical protein